MPTSARALLDRFGHATCRAAQQSRVVHAPARVVERAVKLDRHSHTGHVRHVAASLSLAGRREGRLGEVIDAVVANVQVARAANAQERRLHLEVVVARHAVLDVEARARFRELPHIRRIGLRRLSAERRIVV